MRVLSVMFLVSSVVLGACGGAPDADPASTGSAATDAPAADPAARSAEHTFLLRDGTAPAFVLAIPKAKAHLVITAADPITAEVTRQSDDMQGSRATIDVATVKLLRITDEKTGAGTVLATETIAVRANGTKLDVVAPAAGAFDRYLQSGGSFAISAQRIAGGTSSFFSQIDLSVAASW